MTKEESKMKKLWNYFTTYEKWWFFGIVGLSILVTILFPSSVEDLSVNPWLIMSLYLLDIFLSLLCELLISKQSKWNFIVSILFIEITESILYFSLGYYSVALISIIFWIPIDIVSFIAWHKHPDQKEDVLTEVKRLTWKQDILAVLAILAFGFGVGYILTLIPGAEDTYLDAFTSAVGMANGILILFRYNEQWIAWMMTLILDAALYIMSGSYIMLITVAAMMVNTVYGFIKWLIYTNKNRKEKTIEENKKLEA